MMRQHDFFSALLSAVLCLATFSGSTLADVTTLQLVENFNSMNNDQGYVFKRQTINPTNSSDLYFNNASNTGEIRLENQADSSTGQTPSNDK